MRSAFPLTVAMVALIAASLHAQTAPATAPATQPLQLKTDRLVVFKDGYGLVIKSGTGKADADGRGYITDVPDAAVLGCFWAVGKDNRILGMRAEWVESRDAREQQATCLSMVELLRANRGKSVTLELVDKDPQGKPLEHAAKIVELLDEPVEPTSPTRPASPLRSPFAAHRSAAASRALSSSSAAGAQVPYNLLLREDGQVAFGSYLPEQLAGIGGGTLVRDLVPRGGEFVVLEPDGGRGRLVLPVSAVRSVRGGADLSTLITRKQELYNRTKRLTFDFGKASANQEVSLQLFYFTPGLRWIPTYRIGGDLKEKAEMALQGEVLNEVTDVEGAALDLVVGVPHFRFDNAVSPLVLEQAMRATLASSGVSLGNNSFMNGQFTNMEQRVRVDVPQAREAPATPAVPTELQGASAAAGEQDLFVYTIDGFSLKKGARATVPLWQQTAPLRHVYTYSLPLRRSRSSGQLLDNADAGAPQHQQGQPGSPASPNRIVMNQVWHQLELTNAGDVPWTTGAALMMRGNLPLGQDLLVYTPPTGRTLLPVTVAVDLRGTLEERETERKANALRFDGSEYMQVTKRGTVTLTSYRKEKSSVRVNLGTAGKVTSASDDGRITLNDFRTGDWDDWSYARVNNHSDITWEIEMEPGASKTITYEVSFFTR